MINSAPSKRVEALPSTKPHGNGEMACVRRGPIGMNDRSKVSRNAARLLPVCA
jgi:hypothetical protein